MLLIISLKSEREIDTFIALSDRWASLTRRHFRVSDQIECITFYQKGFGNANETNRMLLVLLYREKIHVLLRLSSQQDISLVLSLRCKTRHLKWKILESTSSAAGVTFKIASYPVEEEATSPFHLTRKVSGKSNEFQNYSSSVIVRLLVRNDTPPELTMR